MFNNNGNIKDGNNDFSIPVEYLKYVIRQAGLGGMMTFKTPR